MFISTKILHAFSPLIRAMCLAHLSPLRLVDHSNNILWYRYYMFRNLIFNVSKHLLKCWHRLLSVDNSTVVKSLFEIASGQLATGYKN